MAGSGTAHLRGDDAILSVEHLVVDYRTRVGTVHAVSDVSFDIVRGETVGIVGESGCGKSTAARAIIRLVEPTAGTVRFGGVDLAHMQKRELRKLRPKLQMIFQDPRSSLNPRRKVKRVVAEGLRIWRRGTNADRDLKVRQALEQVGIDYDLNANRKPGSFSGGQCQRISIARALVVEPEVIICDEPVSALDVSVQAQIINLLADMKEQFGLTMMFISHDLAVVKNVSDRVIVIYLGKICEVGSPEALYGDPAHPYTVGLLSAVPMPDPEAADRPRGDHLWGDLPSPMDPPSGCRFRTRCPRAEPICAEVEPEIRLVEGATTSHFVACHFPVAGPGVRQPGPPAVDTAPVAAATGAPATNGSAPATQPTAAPRTRRTVRIRRFLPTRLLRFVMTLLIVTFMTSLLMNLIPGSPARYILGDAATPASVRALNMQYHFNDSVFQQYWRWLNDLAHFNFGTSAFSKQPVLDSLLERLPTTVELAVLGILVALLVSIPLAMFCAYRPGSKFDRTVDVVTSALISVPVFVWAILLVYFLAVQVHIFPVLGWTPLDEDVWGNLTCIALPVAAISIPEIVVLTRLLRAELITSLQQDYIALAKSKGLSTRRIMTRHALKPASLSMVTVAGLSVARLLGGTVLVESIFVFPGLGTLLIQAIQNRDAVMAQGVVTFIALMVLLVNLAVDISYGFLDPRSRKHA